MLVIEMLKSVSNTPVLGVWDRNPAQGASSMVPCPDCGTLVDLGQNCPKCS